MLSPVDAPSPSIGDEADSLSSYSLLATVAVPNGFAVEAPNFEVDLSAITLAPGRHHVAFAMADPGQFTKGSTQLFLDDVALEPEPSASVTYVFRAVGETAILGSITFNSPPASAVTGWSYYITTGDPVVEAFSFDFTSIGAPSPPSPTSASSATSMAMRPGHSTAANSTGRTRPASR